MIDMVAASCIQTHFHFAKILNKSDVGKSTSKPIDTAVLLFKFEYILIF